MPEYDDPELRSRIATFDADPRAAWVDAQRDRLAAAWKVETITEPLGADSELTTMTAPLALTSTRPRRLRALALAAAAAVLAAVVVGAVLVRDNAPSRAPSRIKVGPAGQPTPAPTAGATAKVPDVAKTHAIVVTPSRGLRDRQIVRVSGRFAPPASAESDLGVQICRAGVTPATAGDDCDGSTAQGTRLADPTATVPFRRYPYMVRRIITVGGQPFDCAGRRHDRRHLPASPGCVLYASGPGRLKGPIHSRYHEKWGVAPLTFDPVAPPLPGPTVTVTPPGALRDGDIVTVRGRHFRPFYWTWVTVCVRGTEVCDGVGVSGDFKVGANGSFSLAHRPWPIFSTGDGTPQDCRVVTCVVRVETSENVDVPISFAPASPTSYPQLTLDPPGPYSDGQQITVTVQGWPGSIGQRPALEIGGLALGVCAQVPGLGTTECGKKAVLLGPNADGHYTATLTLHRTLDVGGAHIDCTQPGNCRVALALLVSPSSPPPHFEVILGTDIVVN